MDEQLKPIQIDNNSNNGLKIIDKEEKELSQIKNNSDIKEDNTMIITNLPDWSIEPPIEINRGQS